MSEGVDILALAAERVWAARRRLETVGAMNDSPQAEIAYQNALVAVEAAERDMRGVRETIAALSTGWGKEP
jgi:hypothetical protein